MTGHNYGQKLMIKMLEQVTQQEFQLLHIHRQQLSTQP